MAKIVAAILVLAGVLGAQGAAREIAAPFEGLDRLTVTRTSPAPEPADAKHFAYEIPPTPNVDTEPESGAIAVLAGVHGLNSDDYPAMEVVYFRDVGVVEEFSTWPYELSGYPNIDLADSDGPSADWKQWREQAIAALPEHLREDSEYRKAIEDQYNLAIAPFESIINGGLELDKQFLSDDVLLAELISTDLKADTISFWKARAIAALPEAERNDPNRLKVIDTTLELMKRSVGGPAVQEPQRGQLQFEVVYFTEMAQKAVR